MKIKRMITVSATALALAGLGTFVSNTNKASASQPVRVFRQTDGRNNHGYYGFYYAKNMEDIGSKIHYQKGLLPRSLRKRNRYVSIWDPAVKAESPTIKRGRSRYYIDDLDTSQRLSHGKYYQNVLINTNDVHGISNRQDRNLIKSIKSQYKRNRRIIKRHRHNHKLVNRLEDQNSFLQIKLNTDNTNNRMRMDPKRKHKVPVKHHAHRHYRRARKHYAKRNIRRNKHKVRKPKKRNHRRPIKSKLKSNAMKRVTYVKQEIALINKDRAAHGKASLKEDPKLDKIAQLGAERMANGAAFGHKNPKTGRWYSAEDAYKLGYIGSPDESGFAENADAGDSTPKDANNSLYTNEEPYNGGHYQNIISEYPDEDYTDVGVGVAYNPNSEYGTYWVEDFNNTTNSGANDFNSRNYPSNSSNDSSDDSSANDDDNEDNESQSQSDYNNNNNNVESQLQSQFQQSQSESDNNTSDNNPLAGETIHKNGVTVTYTKDGMTAHDNNGNTDTASGPNSTINIDGQTFTD